MGLFADDDDDNERILPTTILPVPDHVIELLSDSGQSQSTHSKIMFDGEPNHSRFI